MATILNNAGGASQLYASARDKFAFCGERTDVTFPFLPVHTIAQFHSVDR